MKKLPAKQAVILLERFVGEGGAPLCCGVLYVDIGDVMRLSDSRR